MALELLNLSLDGALQAARRAAREAGAIIRRCWGRLDPETAALKGVHDLVTEVDREAEACILTILREALPESTFVAEESAPAQTASEAPLRWFIDPLDGTTNFVHGVPACSVSIALEAAGELALGVVYELGRDELFWAVRGQGAYLNGQPIRVSRVRRPEHALLATGFPYREFDRIDAYLEVLRYFMRHTQGVRRPGSAAMDLCYVACGRFDGFWELGLSPWDVAAGALIVAEAGGAVTDFDGGSGYLFGRQILATNSHLHSWMLEAVQPLAAKKRLANSS
ncbi:MAG: inositol monophosphatase [Bacteroidetes bacterium]|nr:inositol monophosphatase [Bacteroidota bacterium]